MTPWLQDADLTIHVGDALDVLRAMPDGSVDCCVTSPPYWGLRDYGTGSWDGGDADCDHLGEPFRTKATINASCGTGTDRKNAEDRQPFGATCGKCGARRVDQQLGLEATPDQYVANMVSVFREVRRVLADHGTLWLNLGDSYAGGGRGGQSEEKRSENWQPTYALNGVTPVGLKPKDLVGIPWRVAFALQADGWTLRSDVVWSKLNPMPESVTDRPTKAHEMVFMFSKAKWVGPPRGRYADISDEDARWLALLFDTEGNIVVKKARNGERTQYGAQMAFANTSRPLLERARALVGDGAILERPGTNAPLFYWQMAGREARDLLHRIYPFLIVKHRQAAVAIHMQDVVAEPKKRPGGHRTDEHAAFLDKCWETVKALNSFEHPDISWVPAPRYGKWDSQRYWFDQEAVREPHSPDGRAITGRTSANGTHTNHRLADDERRERWPNGGRNVRSVWEIATQPYPDAHFATFPEELPRRCILAGCPEWVCATCGKARERITETEGTYAARKALGYDKPQNMVVGGHPGHHNGLHPPGMTHDLTPKARVDRGWSDCGHNDYRPGTVLDPFLGSGTTALVARNHGRHTIGIELNHEYARLAATRLQQLSLLADGIA